MTSSHNSESVPPHETKARALRATYMLVWFAGFVFGLVYCLFAYWVFHQ